MKKILITFMLFAISLVSISAQEPRTDSPLPMPTGPYKVGATFRQWIDDSRDEPFTEDPDDKRILSAWIYYPADVPDDAERMPYVMDEATIPTLRFFVEEWDEGDIDEFISTVSQWESYVYQDVDISNGEEIYPIVIFTNPAGDLGFSLQAAELASHGYIVVHSLIVHGYPTTFDQYGKLVIGDYPINFDELMDITVADNIVLLEQLELLNVETSDDIFTGRLDLNRIGILGFSIGGSISRETARIDDRITGGISVDGSFIGGFPYESIQSSFLYFWLVNHPGLNYARSEQSAYLVRFKGFEHIFGDEIFWPGEEDTSQDERTHTVFTTYIRAFFDEYLKGIEQPLLDGVSDMYPEVTIESLNTE